MAANKKGYGHRDFVEATLASLLGVVEASLFAEKSAAAQGWLQPLDARVKVVGTLVLIVASALSHRLWVITLLFGVAIVLALGSRITWRELALRAWLGVLVFTGGIALPALFVTPGRVIYQLPWLRWDVTAQGARSAAFLIARSETAATLAILLVLTTPWPQILKALRVLRVPVVFVVILGMTYRYIFLLLSTALDMFEARRSRMVGELSGGAKRRLAASSAGVLLSKSMQLSNEVYMAMQSRGFRGEVYTLDEFCMRPRDWLALGAFLAMAGAACWAGRA